MLVLWILAAGDPFMVYERVQVTLCSPCMTIDHSNCADGLEGEEAFYTYQVYIIMDRTNLD